MKLGYTVLVLAAAFAILSLGYRPSDAGWSSGANISTHQSGFHSLLLEVKKNKKN